MQCPHCQHPFEVPSGLLLSDARCPSCGKPIKEPIAIKPFDDQSPLAAEPLEGDSHRAFETPRSHAFVAATGTIIAGRYRMLQHIAEGGMGTVWMAEQRAPMKKRVALKLVKPGLATKDMLARFEAERQALAMMDHPNIAQVLDGGTTDDGQPFFVMEYVKGIPLTNYCDERKLSVPARLELFLQICQAVQHAHQKAIIHRDLKPSNILVAEHDDKPLPKVIDFGLAKALQGSHVLTDRTMFTALGSMVGTPPYMAPEQFGVNALDVDTRTDVYALGAILYELLTGSTPIAPRQFKDKSWDEVCRMIRVDDAERPSQRLGSSETLVDIATSRGTSAEKLIRQVRGDLDVIVERALEKERSQRFPSADAMAAQLRLYLDGEPIGIRPITRRERAWRWCKRNPLVAGFAAAFLLSLAAGACISTYLAIGERRMAAEARSSAQTAQENAAQANLATKAALDAKENEAKERVRAEHETQRNGVTTSRGITRAVGPRSAAKCTDRD